MKVRINGFDIECTPEEFLRLTLEMEVGQLVDEFQTLPDDVKIGHINLIQIFQTTIVLKKRLTCRT